MKYPAKKDTWAVWLFALGILVAIGVGIYIATLNLVAGVSLAVFFVLFLGSIFFWTSYEINSSYVVVRVGPLPVWRVRIEEIMEAALASSVSATAHFAWSSDAIRITCHRKIFGFLPPTVSISPRDRTGFLKELAAVSSDLEMCDDRAVRRRRKPTE